VLPRIRDPRQAGIFDAALPAFIRPQLAKLVTEAPEGERWAHELKFDGYRIHARLDRGGVQLITARSALDWTSKYLGLADWLKELAVVRAYLEGELCAVRPDGTTSFSLMLWPQCGPNEVELNERYFKQKDAVENYWPRK
jgi:ATP-dependent DNA ligase